MSAVECPSCMPKHYSDLAQSDAWKEEHGVCSEGWLFPSRDYPGLLHCNCCGSYFRRLIALGLFPVPPSQLSRWELA